MNDSDKYQRVADDDPRRCQVVTARGQCNIIAVEGGKVCWNHGGNVSAIAAEKRDLRNYNLTRWKNRVNQMSDNPKVKSLREEIGILRLTLETQMNMCQSETDLLIHSHVISKLVNDIDKIVNSCHRLEGQLGQTMDKSALINFASKVVSIVSEVLAPVDGDGSLSEQIANRLLAEISE